MSSNATTLSISRVLLLLFVLVILGAPLQAAATSDPNIADPETDEILDDDIALLVVTDSTNPNAFCTETENAHVAERFLEDVFGTEDGDDSDDESEDENESEDEDSSDDRRMLKRRNSCRNLCRKFKRGHCHVVWPKCRGFRFLEGEEGDHQDAEQPPKEDVQTRRNLRNRKLGDDDGDDSDDSDDHDDLDSGWIRKNGNWESWDEAPPEAHQQCLAEKAKLEYSMARLQGDSSLDDPCKLLYSAHVEVGCANMGGSGSGIP